MFFTKNSVVVTCFYHENRPRVFRVSPVSLGLARRLPRAATNSLPLRDVKPWTWLRGLGAARLISCCAAWRSEFTCRKGQVKLATFFVGKILTVHLDSTFLGGKALPGGVSWIRAYFHGIGLISIVLFYLLCIL